MTAVSVDSRTTVLGQTQKGLTSGFGMGPGKHLRCDRAPIFFRIGMTRQVSHRELACLLDEGHSRCGYIMKKMLEQLVLLD